MLLSLDDLLRKHHEAFAPQVAPARWAVQEELEEALGAGAYERGEGRRGYRNGRRERTLSGPTGPVALTVPRATLFGTGGEREWSSSMLPRYQRRMPELNEAIIATYLSGANTRRIKGALKPLLNAAPLSKSSVSRVVCTMQNEMAAWRSRSLSALKPIYLYLDAFALRVRSGGKVVSVPVARSGGSAGRRQQAAALAGDVRSESTRRGKAFSTTW